MYITGSVLSLAMCAALDNGGHKVPHPVLVILFWPLVVGDSLGQYMSDSYEKPTEEKETEDDK